MDRMDVGHDPRDRISGCGPLEGMHSACCTGWHGVYIQGYGYSGGPCASARMQYRSTKRLWDIVERMVSRWMDGRWVGTHTRDVIIWDLMHLDRMWMVCGWYSDTSSICTTLHRW